MGPSSIAGDEDGRYAEEMEEVVGRWRGAPRASSLTILQGRGRGSNGATLFFAAPYDLRRRGVQRQRPAAICGVDLAWKTTGVGARAPHVTHRARTHRLAPCSAPATQHDVPPPPRPRRPYRLSHVFLSLVEWCGGFKGHVVAYCGGRFTPLPSKWYAIPPSTSLGSLKFMV